MDRGDVKDATGFLKTTAKNEPQEQMDPVTTESSRENNINYGLLQDMLTPAEILCATPRVPGAGFSGWMEDSRCQNCASFLNYQRKKNVPKAESKERQPQKRELVARQHVWTPGEDETLKASNKAGMKFTEIVIEHFPQMTAQALRERIALLKTYKRKARRSGLNTEKGISKAPNWTDDEIQVLRNGIIGRKPAKSLIPLLPQRTITSIRTKMSSLRKVEAKSAVGLYL